MQAVRMNAVHRSRYYLLDCRPLQCVHLLFTSQANEEDEEVHGMARLEGVRPATRVRCKIYGMHSVSAWYYPDTGSMRISSWGRRNVIDLMHSADINRRATERWFQTVSEQYANLCSKLQAGIMKKSDQEIARESGLKQHRVSEQDVCALRWCRRFAS